MNPSDQSPSVPREDAAGDDSFLSRWSRRKQGLREEAESDPAPAPAAGVPEPEPETAEPVLRDEDMPPLESIDQTRDVSPFLSRGVSEKLRRQALRRLFALPGFNVRDGLDDYDEDYRSFAALGDIVTSDMKFDQERLERLARERRAEQSAPPDQDSSGDELAGAPQAPRASHEGSGPPPDDSDAEEEI